MDTAARIATPEAEGLTLRMARHFGHKVPVTQVEGATRIETRFGTIELRPAEDELLMTVAGAERDQARLREVAASHLERFARAPIVIDWE